MTFRFVHLGVNFGNIPWTQFVDGQMPRVAVDWIRYSATDWIMWTDKPLYQLTHELRSLVSAHDQFVLFEFAAHAKDGWHQQWVWDWLNVARDSKTGYRIGANPLAFLLPPSSKS